MRSPLHEHELFLGHRLGLALASGMPHNSAMPKLGGQRTCEGQMTSGTAPVERRASPRQGVLRHATIVFHGRTIPCNLVDESETGARLANGDIASYPPEFALHLEGDYPRKCRIVWRSPAEMGVQYGESDRARRLRRIIARFERLLSAGVDDAGIAASYRAEITAAQAMLDELEPRPVGRRPSRIPGSEDDLRRAERHVREAERHVSRQNAVVQRLETLGDPAETQAARERLAALQKDLELARETLRRQQSRRRL